MKDPVKGQTWIEICKFSLLPEILGPQRRQNLEIGKFLNKNMYESSLPFHCYF